MEKYIGWSDVVSKVHGIKSYITGEKITKSSKKSTNRHIKKAKRSTGRNANKVKKMSEKNLKKVRKLIEDIRPTPTPKKILKRKYPTKVGAKLRKSFSKSKSGKNKGKR